MVAARLDSDLVARMDRLVEQGVVATRTELIERAVSAWTEAAEADRWADVVDAGDTLDEGFTPTWDDDGTDWAELYGDVLDASSR
jgi:hypothetical protein